MTSQEQFRAAIVALGSSIQALLTAFDELAGAVTPPPPPPPPPASSITLTAPPAGVVAAGTVQFAATVVDQRPVSYVEYLVDGVPATQSDPPPPPFTKPGTIRAGAHELAARVTFRDGTKATSPVVKVTTPVVDPPPVDPPPVDPPPVTPGLISVAKIGAYNVTVLNGKRWLGLGPNQYVFSYNSPGDMTPLSRWIVANAAKWAGELAGRGVNYVPIPINNDLSAAYITSLKTVTNALWAKGIRTCLRPFGGVAWAPSAQTGNLAADVWTALGRPQWVLLCTVNEPNPQAYSDTPQAWYDGNLACIRAMRAKGYRQPIMVGCRSWAWTIPVAEAKALLAFDSQLVFTSHRYAFDGSSIRGAGDAAAWRNEWKAAADAGCPVGVEEWGFWNGGGSYASIQGWCKPVGDAHVVAVQEGWLSMDTPWEEIWDQNSLISGDRGGDWWDITQGETYHLSEWGVVAYNTIARERQIVPA